MTEQEALDAWRRAIAATKPLAAAANEAIREAERAALKRGTGSSFIDLRPGYTVQETHNAAFLALHAECMAGRRYLAARDAATAREVTCSEAGPGAADFAGDA